MEKKQKALVLVDSGLTYDEVSQKLGVTRSTVAGWVYRHRTRNDRKRLEHKRSYQRDYYAKHYAPKQTSA